MPRLLPVTRTRSTAWPEGTTSSARGRGSTPAFPPTHGRDTMVTSAIRKITMAVLAPAMALGATVGLAAAPASAAVWNSCDQWGNTSLNGYRLYNNIWG